MVLRVGRPCDPVGKIHLAGPVALPDGLPAHPIDLDGRKAVAVLVPPGQGAVAVLDPQAFAVCKYLVAAIDEDADAKLLAAWFDGDCLVFLGRYLVKDAGDLPAVVRSVEQPSVVLLVADGAGQAYQILLCYGHCSITPKEDVEKLGLLDVLVDFRVVVPSVAAGPLDDDPVEKLLTGLHLAQKPSLRLLATAHVELDDVLADQVFGDDEVLLVPTPRRSAGLHLVSAGGQGVRRQRSGPDATGTELVKHLLQSSYFPSKTARLFTTELKHEGQLNSVNCVGGGLQTAPTCRSGRSDWCWCLLCGCPRPSSLRSW